MKRTNHTVMQSHATWESLSVEERKRRIAVRISNMGKYRDTLIVTDKSLMGEA